MLVRRSPLNALPRPEDVAKGVSYLFSDAGDMITGTTITIDAGNTI